MNYFRFAADLARLDAITYAPSCDPRGIHIEHLTISAAAMPTHYTARAVILDLQPEHMIRAIAAVEERIREEHPLFVRTGWRATSDGVYLHFFSATTSAQKGGTSA